VRLEEWDPEAVLRRRREIAQVWTWTSEERVEEILPRHVGRRGFRFLAARNESGTLVGFAYGYLGAPGQWWHDLVSGAMTAEQRARWLAPGHFELVELHVRPDQRRRGVGALLHDALLEPLESPTAVLSTQVDNAPALSLYRNRGWQLVVPELDFGSGRLFCIMGIELRQGASGPAQAQARAGDVPTA
jgi:ribosomal protein S18 acetylase RimI-like enzyme